MINIVVPIIDENKEKFLKLLSKIDGAEELAVYVGVENKNKDVGLLFEESENISVLVYEDGADIEELINGLQRYVGMGATVILRKPISLDELSRFLNCKQDIATCKKQRSKIKGFIFNIWQSIIKLFLGIKEYEGDTSVVYLSEDISAVVGESGNLSFSTRANRWRGIEQSTIEVKGEPIKHEIDKKTVLKYSLIATVALLLGVIVTTVVCLTVKVSIIIGLLLICLDMICLAVAVLTIIITIFNTRVGKKRVNEAKDINSIDDEI